ncbi:transcription factor MafK-like [Stylophora pistillata]|nr:transcription factor MafK-like [Stylophora pistillata]
MEATNGRPPKGSSFPIYSFKEDWPSKKQADLEREISTSKDNGLNADLLKANSSKRIQAPGDSSEQNEAKKSKQRNSNYLSRRSVVPLSSDEKLEKMPIQALNRRLRKLPQGLAQKFRKRRRILKNRKYASKCRKKNTSKEENIIQENKDLQLEISKVKEELEKVVSEKNDFKMKCGALNAKLVAWGWNQGSDVV